MLRITVFALGLGLCAASIGSAQAGGPKPFGGPALPAFDDFIKGNHNNVNGSFDGVGGNNNNVHGNGILVLGNHDTVDAPSIGLAHDVVLGSGNTLF